MRQLIRKVNYLFKPRLASFIKLTLFLFALGILEVAGIFLFVPITQLIFIGGSPSSIFPFDWILRFFETVPTNIDIIILTIMLLIYVLVAVSRITSVFVTSYIANKTELFLAKKLAEKYLNQDYLNHLRKKNASITHLVMSELPQLSAGVISPLTNLAIYSSVAFAILISLFIYNFFATLIALAFLISVYILIYTICRPISLQNGVMRTENNSKRFSEIQFSEKNLAYIQITKTESLLLKSIIASSTKVARSQVIAAVIASVPKHIIELIVFGALIITLLVFSFKELATETLGTGIIVFLFAGSRLLPSMQMIYSSLAQVRHYRSSFDIVLNYLDSMKLKLSHLEDEIQDRSKINSIKLRNFKFYFDADSSLGFPKNIDIKANTLNVVTGASGSGKSTLMKILVGLIRPLEGDLLVNEKLTKSRPYEIYNIAYVSQNDNIQDWTLEKLMKTRNLDVGSDEFQMRLVSLLKLFKLHILIDTSQKPRLQLKIGEGGIALSGGERQRLQIIREVLANPELLVLDEVTSSLDMQNSLIVFEAIDKLKNETLIITTNHDKIFEKFDHNLISLGK